MNTSLFLTFPDVIVLEILMNWLQLADVGHVDSAYCSVAARPQFLTLLSAYRVFSNRRTIESVNDYHILVWTVKRSIKVKGFTITSKVAADNNLQDALFAISGSSVQWIAFDGINCAKKLAKAVAKAVKDSPNTEILHIVRTYKASTSFNDYKCYPLLTQAFQRLHTLHIEYTALSSKEIAMVLQNCRILQNLHFQSLSSILPVEVTLPSLEQFSAEFCKVPEAVLFAIATKCHRIKHMKMFRNDSVVSNQAVQAILQGCPLLQYTDVQYARGLSHELLVELARRRNFTELRFGFNNWKDATSELCTDILRESQNLQELAVYSCPWLMDDVLAVCGQRCKNLESLQLEYCNDVTVAGILAITAPGNKLKRVLLTGCRGLGDEAVLAVAQRCPHLKEFNSPLQVSSEALVALAKGCPLLEEIFLKGTGVDDTAVTALAQHCPQLKFCSIAGCPRITKAVREAVKERNKRGFAQQVEAK